MANQKLDLELQLRALDVQHQQQIEEEFLVTKTIAAEQVHREWEQWKPAMMADYNSIVQEKKAVRQVSRAEAATCFGQKSQV